MEINGDILRYFCNVHADFLAVALVSVHGRDIRAQGANGHVRADDFRRRFILLVCRYARISRGIAAARGHSIMAGG